MMDIFNFASAKSKCNYFSEMSVTINLALNSEIENFDHWYLLTAMKDFICSCSINVVVKIHPIKSQTLYYK